MAEFKLLASQHIQGDPEKSADPKTGRRPSRTFVAGDIVESDLDLVKLHGAEKFQLVSGSPAGSTPLSTKGKPAPDLKNMSKPELFSLADDLEVDLEGVRSKEEAIEKIQAKLASS